MLRVERQDYQVMPPLSPEEYSELKEDIRQRGVMVPIEYDENGNVLDGHHRLRICAELGITDFPKVIRAGLTEEQKRTHARKLNMARRQLNREQKQELIREQLRETPEKSDRQIARELGVDKNTVNARRIEYRDRIWVLFEAKLAGKEVPYGQKLALARFVADAGKSGKCAIAMVVDHYSENPADDIILQNCYVREIITTENLMWRPPKRRITAKEMADAYINYNMNNAMEA